MIGFPGEGDTLSGDRSICFRDQLLNQRSVQIAFNQ